jgi:hypothetical protein
LQQLCEAGGEEFNAACAELMRRCKQNKDAEACRLISDYNQRLGELCRAGDQSACRTLLNRCNAGDKDYSDPNSACKQRSTCTPERETELNQQIKEECAFPRELLQCINVQASCEDIHARIAIYTACIAAREQIVNECYHSIADEGHRTQIEQHRQGLQNCNDALNDTNPRLSRNQATPPPPYLGCLDPRRVG